MPLVVAFLVDIIVRRAQRKSWSRGKLTLILALIASLSGALPVIAIHPFLPVSLFLGWGITGFLVSNVLGFAGAYLGALLGVDHPPYVKPPLGSTSGPSSDCMTPSRVRKERTISFLMGSISPMVLSCDFSSQKPELVTRLAEGAHHRAPRAAPPQKHSTRTRKNFSHLALLVTQGSLLFVSSFVAFA